MRVATTMSGANAISAPPIPVAPGCPPANGSPRWRSRTALAVLSL